jgi:hypothetical protein
MALGWCSPAPPIRVYDRSNPFGPSIFISQLSFSRDPIIETRHSPGAGECMLNRCHNFRARSRIARVLHLNGYCHIPTIVPRRSGMTRDLGHVAATRHA